MKEATGMSNVMTQTEGLRQTMELREAGERRAREFHPVRLGQEQVGLSAARRKEAAAVEAATEARKTFDMGEATPELLSSMATFLDQYETLKERKKQQAIPAEVGQQVAEARQATSAAELGGQLAEGRKALIPTQLTAEDAALEASIVDSYAKKDYKMWERILGLPRITAEVAARTLPMKTQIEMMKLENEALATQARLQGVALAEAKHRQEVEMYELAKQGWREQNFSDATMAFLEWRMKNKLMVSEEFFQRQINILKALEAKLQMGATIEEAIEAAAADEQTSSDSVTEIIKLALGGQDPRAFLTEEQRRIAVDTIRRHYNQLVMDRDSNNPFRIKLPMAELGPPSDKAGGAPGPERTLTPGHVEPAGVDEEVDKILGGE